MQRLRLSAAGRCPAAWRRGVCVQLYEVVGVGVSACNGRMIAALPLPSLSLVASHRLAAGGQPTRLRGSPMTSPRARWRNKTRGVGCSAW